jgi:hypothetical protein
MLSNTTFLIIGLFIFFWIYCIASCVLGKFKNRKDKIFWTIGVIFVPFLSFFYIYLRRDLLEN